MNAWQTPVVSVNFHVWQPCNMHCRFCFARFLDVKHSVVPAGHLERHDALKIVDLLAAAGFRKINFAGGEPLLCPWLGDLIAAAKTRHMTTSIVTNGILIDDAFIAKVSDILDWVALSVDSAEPQTLLSLGRSDKGSILASSDAVRICRKLVATGIRLKINTVVTAANFREDISAFIATVLPSRWKVMMMLLVADQNDRSARGLGISGEQFEYFLGRHLWLKELGIEIVSEDNDQMTGSYVMVDPAGRFFDNVESRHHYSESILDVGVRRAFGNIRVDREKFLERGGLYDWSRRQALYGRHDG